MKMYIAVAYAQDREETEVLPSMMPWKAASACLPAHGYNPPTAGPHARLS